MGKERRQHDRVPESFLVRCRRSEISKQWEEVQSINMSVGGLRFMSRLPFEQDTELEIEMTIPNSNKMLRLNATVVFVKTVADGVIEVSIQFRDLSPDQEVDLDELVHFLTSKPKSIEPPDDAPGPAPR